MNDERKLKNPPECDTLYDTYTLREIPPDQLFAASTTCRRCGNTTLVLTHADHHPIQFMDVFVRCSVECKTYVRLRVRAP